MKIQMPISRVPGRALLLCHGPDTRAFLQGLTTQNLNRFAPESGESAPDDAQPARAALFTAFLHASVRWEIHSIDAFIEAKK